MRCVAGPSASSGDLLRSSDADVVLATAPNVPIWQTVLIKSAPLDQVWWHLLPSAANLSITKVWNWHEAEGERMSAFVR